MVKPVQGETEFISAVRRGYDLALPGRVEFHKQYFPGQPDWYMKIFTDKTKAKLMYDCYAEFKWRRHTPRALTQEWGLCSLLQRLTMLRMANEGKNVFLVVGCEETQEAPWYYLLPAQVKKVIAREAPAETALALMMLSRRWKPGAWSTGSEHGEPDEGPRMTWGQKMAKAKRAAQNGLILPPSTKGLIKPK